MDLPPDRIHGSVRFSLGHFNTEADINFALDIIPKAVDRLRTLSPIWEDRQKANV